MKKLLHSLIIVFLVSRATLVCGQGAVYIFEKIPNSEFYTYTTEPVKGMVEFSETVFPPYGRYMIEVLLRNNSNKTIDLKNASYMMVTKDRKKHKLEFEEIEVNTGAEKSFALDPEHIIIIYCRSPIRNDDVREIYIQLTNGSLIHFVPYSRLGSFVKSPDKYLKDLLSGLMEVFRVFKLK